MMMDTDKVTMQDVYDAAARLQTMAGVMTNAATAVAQMVDASNDIIDAAMDERAAFGSVSAATVAKWREAHETLVRATELHGEAAQRALDASHVVTRVIVLRAAEVRCRP